MMKHSVKKVFNIKRNSKIAIFSLGFFVCFILSMALLVFCSSFWESVTDSMNQFGEYAFRVDSVDKESISKINENSAIDNVYYVDRIECNKENDNHSYVYFNISKDKLNLLGFDIINGKFPENEKEVLLDYLYLSYMKWDLSIVGQKVTINDKGQEKEYIVSGIIKKKEAFEGSDIHEFDFILSNDTKENNCAYFTLKQYSNFKEELENIQTNFSKDIYPNWGMYLDLGYANDVSLYEQNQVIYNYIYIVIVFCMIFLTYNIIKYCINDQYEKFAICNLLGINRIKSISSFAYNIFQYMIYGGITGYMFSLVSIFIVHRRLYGSNKIFFRILETFPVGEYCKGILVCILILAFVLLPIAFKLYKLSPCALLKEKNGLFSFKVKKSNKYVLKKSKFFELKMSGHYLKNNVVTRLFATIGCFVASCIIIVGSYYTQISYSDEEINSRYAYSIRLYEYYSDNQNIDEKEKKLEDNLGFSEAVNIHYLYEETVNAVVAKSKLSKQYEEYIYQDISKKVNNLAESNVNINISILGYSEEEIKRLHELNTGMKVTTLQDKEAFVVTDIETDYYADKNFYTYLTEGDFIKIDFDDDDRQNVSLKIVDNINTLSVRPENGKYRIVVIVSEAYFKKLFDVKIPQKVFVDDMIQESQIGDYRNLQELEIDSGYMVEYPREEYENEKELNRILDIFVYITFGLTILISITLIVSNNILKLSINKKEYAMMKAIGVCNKKLYKIFFYEGLIVVLQAQFIAWIVSYFVTKYAFLLKYPQSGTYLYNYPYNLIIKATILTLVFWMLSLVFIFMKIRNINTNKELRSIN